MSRDWTRLAPDVERELFHLSVQFAGAIDRRDTAALVDVFTSDGVLDTHRPGFDLPLSRKGHDEIRALAHRFTRYSRTYYFLGQASYAPAEDERTATGEVLCVGHHIDHADGLVHDLATHLRYQDDYIFDRGQWRIARRAAYVEFETLDNQVIGVRPHGFGSTSSGSS